MTPAASVAQASIHAQRVVTRSQPMQPLEPADRPLDYPADFAQPATMRRPPLSDVRLNPQPDVETERLGVAGEWPISLVGPREYQVWRMPTCEWGLDRELDHGESSLGEIECFYICYSRTRRKCPDKH